MGIPQEQGQKSEQHRKCRGEEADPASQEDACDPFR